MTASDPLPLSGALQDVAFVAVLAIGTAAVGFTAWLRVARGARPWDLVDGGVALFGLLWCSAGATLLGMRLGAGAWVPSEDEPLQLGAAIAGSAIGGGLVALFALARAGWAGLGLSGPVTSRALLGAVAFQGPFLLLSAGWTLALEALGVEVADQQLLTAVQAARGDAVVWVAAVYGVLLAPLLEEALFRGFLLPAAARRYGRGVAIAATAILFGAMHASDPIAVVPLAALGAALGWLRVWSGSLWPCLLLHALNNGLAMAVVLGPSAALSFSGTHESADAVEHRRRVPLDLHRVPELSDRTVWRDEEGAADDPHAGLAVHLLLAPHAPRLGDGAVGVGDEREGEALLGLEPIVALDAVAAHPHDDGPEGGEVIVQIAEVPGLGGAAGRGVARVEVDDDRAALLRSEVEVPVGGGALKRRALRSSGRH